MAIDLTELAKQHALIFLGISRGDLRRDYEHYRTWIEEGRHGEMSYLERYVEERGTAESIFPQTRSILSVALSYAGDKLGADPAPRTAGYAKRRDYHRVLRERCEQFCQALHEQMPQSQFRITVDTAPVLERSVAAQTRRGFVGKNTLFIHPEWGSYLLLAEIFTDGKWPADTSPAIDLARKTKEGGCGPCDRCQTACPTGALDEAYRIDARKCLSYWTIEHRGVIPVQYWPHLKDYWFGCDICQDVCPYNIKVKDRAEWSQIPQQKLPTLLQTAMMDQAQYEAWYGGTPITRAKRGGLRRNALIALYTLGDPELPKAISAAQSDPIDPLPETLEQLRALRGL